MTDPLELAIFRRHAGDATLLAGGAAAILLQLADPRVARGVAGHSAFRTDPLARLRGTLDYVYAIGFGDDRLRRAAAAEVNARHRPVRGEASGAAPAYSAFDRDAQRFVASTLLAVALELEERIAGRRIDEPTADVLVRGYGALGSNLQAGRAGWPQTRREFDGWWRDRVELLDVGDDARAIASALLREPALPAPMLAALPPLRVVTAALLPARIRAGYGLRLTPRAERVADGWFRAIRIARLVVPNAIRRAPMRNSLRRSERRNHYAEIGIGTG